MDVTDTTAEAADVASGEYFYAADGTRTAGTASGGGADLKAFIERSTSTPQLPNDLTAIANYAFYTWNSLALTSLPSGVTSIGNSAFYGCVHLALTSLPSGLTSIGSNAFYNCTELVTISCAGVLGADGMMSGAFHRCSNLKSASFPNMTMNSLDTVFGATTGSSACQKLETADIGKTAEISASAFNNCRKLQTLVLRKADAICTLANTNAFNNTPMSGYNSLTGTVYVPSALISTYQTASNWSTLYNNGTLTFAAIEGSQYEL